MYFLMFVFMLMMYASIAIKISKMKFGWQILAAGSVVSMPSIYAVGYIPTNVIQASFDVGQGTLMICYLGLWITAIATLLTSLVKIGGKKELEEREAKFKSMSVEQLVDMIDQRACGSVIASNNPWLAKNWSTLSDVEKKKWVTERRDSLLRDLPAVNGAPQFITAMQTADKELSRKAA